MADDATVIDEARKAASRDDCTGDCEMLVVKTLTGRVPLNLVEVVT